MFKKKTDQAAVQEAFDPNAPNASWERSLIRDYIFTLHKEQVRDRRWRWAVKILRATGWVFIGVTVAVTAIRAGEGSPQPSTVPHTAYIKVQGEITAEGAASADRIIPALEKAFGNENAKAVVLRINSPGGSPVQAGRIYDELKSLREKHPEKKVYAVVDEIGASGGYYIAVGADEIYADRSSLIGSIGVISSSFGFVGLMEKLGIERRAITAGENKALLDPFAPLDPEIKKFWEAVLERTNQQFIARVKEGRGERLKPEPRIFSGLLWSGEQALELGMIDGLGSLQSVARDVVGQDVVIDYSIRPDIFGRIADKARVQVESLFDSSAHTPTLF